MKKKKKKFKERRTTGGSTDYNYISGKSEKKRENFSLHNRKLQEIIDKSNKKMAKKFSHDKGINLEKIIASTYKYKNKYSLVRVNDKNISPVDGFKTDNDFKFGVEAKEIVKDKENKRGLNNVGFDAFKKHFEGMGFE